ncbi:MAG: DEAD/DEAH box helicase family protein [Cyanophyceae cyanobacterium]
MARLPKLTFDRGTLLLHPPPRGQGWLEFAVWDDRVEKFRIPARLYRRLVERLRADGVTFEDGACGFSPLDLRPCLEMEPYAHQREALAAWKRSGRQGVVVLPTAAGKTYLAQLAMEATPRTTLVVVPTLDLMHQWYAHLEAAFPDVAVGLLGGGSRDESPILVATYDSAAIHAERWGANYATIIFDECHHLPSDFNRVIAEYAIAPYRLGLTATPERADGRHADLDELIGPEVYRRSPEDLSGLALADHEVVQISVHLAQQERDRYDAAIALRNDFLRSHHLSFGSIDGWQRFIQLSARSAAGRQAMLAHHEAKAIALGTDAKVRVLTDLLSKHQDQKILIFTNDNATVYRISQDFLIPAITHQTPVKERHDILTQFKAGVYRAIVVANVLDEGVDVPDASIAIFLAGTGSMRQFIQRLGRILRKGKHGQKRAILYEVIAADTVEERTSDRRRGQSFGEPVGEPTGPEPGVQLDLMPKLKKARSRFRAAEAKGQDYGAPPEAPSPDGQDGDFDLS